MWYVNLVNVKCRALHGVYAEEQLLGNDFLVNITVGFEKENIITLDDSINYETIYAILVQEMKNTKPLLEQVIDCLAKQLKEKFATIIYQKISIKKLHPAFAKDTLATEIILEKKY